jgi:hypothetical protein
MDRIGTIAVGVVMFVSMCICNALLLPKARTLSKAHAAVVRILADVNRAAKSLPDVQKGTASQSASGIAAYCDAMERIDMSDCPADFRAAVAQHLSAGRDLQAWFNSLSSLSREGPSNVDVDRLTRDGHRIGGRFDKTAHEVTRIAATYGVVLSPPEVPPPATAPQ